MKHKIFTYLYFLVSLSLSTTIHSEGFGANTLVTTQHGLIPIEQLTTDNLVVSHSNTKQNIFPITHTHNYTTDSYIKITITDLTIYAAPDQCFYSITRNLWIKAQDLKQSEVLMCANTSTIMIDTVETISAPIKMYSITIQTSHIYCISPYEIIVHNFEPGTTSIATALISFVCPPAAPFVITAEAIIGTVIAGACLYATHKKHKKNQTFSQITQELKSNSSNLPNPKKPDDEDENKHPHGKYEDAPYHHQNSKGKKGPCPKDGQTALDKSIPIGSNESFGRVGISNGEIVILRKTSEKLYHGYVMTWKNLLEGAAKTEPIRKALIDSGLVTKKGKII